MVERLLEVQIPPLLAPACLNLFSVCVCVLACPYVPMEAPRGVFGVIGVTGGCEMPDVDPGNRTWVLCKSSKL